MGTRVCMPELVWLCATCAVRFPRACSLPQLQPAAASPAFLLLQSWSAPPDLAPVQDYMNAVSARQSWRGTQAPIEDIIDHWCAHAQHPALIGTQSAWTV